MMAQVARAHTQAAGGDPRALKRLAVQFRHGVPGEELVVTSTVAEAGDGRIVTDTVAQQDGNELIRTPGPSSPPPDARSRGGPFLESGLC